jgi:hypothetical protein
VDCIGRTEGAAYSIRPSWTDAAPQRERLSVADQDTVDDTTKLTERNPSGSSSVDTVWELTADGIDSVGQRRIGDIAIGDVCVTILVTEIHRFDRNSAFILFGADKKIMGAGQPPTFEQKVFQLQNIPAGIGFFGLAEVEVNGKKQSMSTWLESFVTSDLRGHDLGSIAWRLVDALHESVSPQAYAKCMSGFHLAGFNNEKQVEFWYVRNVSDERELLGHYAAREDFQNRDAAEVPDEHYWIYRNGFLHGHQEIWDMMDGHLNPLLDSPGFRQLSTPEHYKAWLRIKLSVLVSFHTNFHDEALIGGDVDTFVIHRPEKNDAITTPSGA